MTGILGDPTITGGIPDRGYFGSEQDAVDAFFDTDMGDALNSDNEYGQVN